MPSASLVLFILNLLIFLIYLPNNEHENENEGTEKHNMAPATLLKYHAQDGPAEEYTHVKTESFHNANTPASPNARKARHTNVAGTDNSKDEELKSPWILHPSLVLKEDVLQKWGKGEGEIPDPDEVLDLKEERKGWHGYVEWELYPERKARVKEWMKGFDFPSVCVSPFSSFLFLFFFLGGEGEGGMNKNETKKGRKRISDQHSMIE
jgi:hypothetical protein